MVACMMDFNVVLFDDFESLNVFGPVAIAGKLENRYQIEYFSLHGGVIHSSQNAKIQTLPLQEIKDGGVVLIPGGPGAMKEADHPAFVGALRDVALKAAWVLTACTGSGLLAKTGLLKNIRATSNKMTFNWAVRQDPEVLWVRKARWVSDGKYYTSSGVSAGMDMTLGFINDVVGKEAVEKICKVIEYIWNPYQDNDPFAKTGF